MKQRLVDDASLDGRRRVLFEENVAYRRLVKAYLGAKKGVENKRDSTRKRG